MILDDRIAETICAIESIIGHQTYNPNSYNGWTGEEGCSFRYPLNYCKTKEDLEAHRLTKTKYGIDEIDPECVPTMKYAFGSNHLYIGDGIVEALEYLEKTYDIDFNELEEKRTEKRKKLLKGIKEKLDKGHRVTIEPGKKIVGIDLPVGEYTVINPKDGYSSYVMMNICDGSGEEVNDIFSSDDMIDVSFSDGFIVKSHDSYTLEKREK